MDQAIISITPAGRPWLVSRRSERRLGLVLLISLWLHLSLLMLAIMKVHFDQTEEELPPPSTIAMVFEGGQPKGPALPNPQPNVAAPAVPPPRAAPPPPVPEPAPAPQEALVPPPSPEAAPIPAPLPVPPAPVPPAPAAEVPAPRPPPVAMVMPRPAPPQRARPAQRPPMAQPRPQAFPTPMNFSFSRPVPQTSPAMRATSRTGPTVLDFSLAPRRGATDNTPFSRVAGAHVGPDWRNELSAWVHAHAYYPQQAAMNDEDGDVTVQVVANPNGHVASVQMVSRSGSQWLDMALMGLFRDANLPPLHDENEPITFNFTMHYILIRMR